jgi:hypothetical protein
MRRRKRKAWLITWHSSRQDYLNDLGRPIIVAILDSRVPGDAIGYMLQALYCSESGLTLLEKLTIGSVEARRRYGKGYLSECRFGDNPCLVARRVKDLYIERISAWEQTVFWTEEAEFTHESCSNRLKEIVPDRAMSYTERYSHAQSV